MTLQRTYPFRRVSVDRMMHGVTRIWWQIDPLFQELGPYTFQLQVGGTGLAEGVDWQNVGEPIVNGFVAEDSGYRGGGSVVNTHYRVTLTTPTGDYVSAPAPCFGELNEKDWLMAREIIRKELLRHQKVSIDGYLIKALRYGKPCPRCRDAMTQEPTDNNCSVCLGSGFEGGYHPPLPMQCWDLSPQLIRENQDINVKGTTREDAYVNARVIGFPALNRDDIWVNASTDERWLIKEIQIAAALHGVPLIYNVRLGLVPFTNSIYEIPLEPEAPEVFTPKEGRGCVTVTADYAGVAPEALKYANAAGEYIADAFVYAFKKSVFDSSYPVYPAKNNAEASSRTNANGSWISEMKLDPGEYVLMYEKPNEFGPDFITFTVLDPCAVAGPCSSNSSSSCSSTCATPTVQRKQFNNFWDI